MPHSGIPAARGHLRLATHPDLPRPTGDHLMLVLRSILVAAAVLWVSAIAWMGATLALLPLLWHRAPVGRRLHPRPSRDARVIPFQRRQAVPR